jgi:hypothetical protein
MSMNTISTPAALRAGRATSSPLHAGQAGSWQFGGTHQALGTIGYSAVMPVVAPQRSVGRDRATADAKQDRPPRGVGS